MIKRLFLDHPRAVNETYGVHMAAASGFGFAMIGAGVACLVHALVPGIFTTTASDVIERLSQTLVRNRRDRMRRPEETTLCETRDIDSHG